VFIQDGCGEEANLGVSGVQQGGTRFIVICSNMKVHVLFEFVDRPRVSSVLRLCCPTEYVVMSD
jgi:hypothetical protein